MTILIRERGDALRTSLFELRAEIENSPHIPPAKRDELRRLWAEPPRWRINEVALEPGLVGRTLHQRHVIEIDRDLIDATQTGSATARTQARDRLRAVVFHELVHATGEKELDAEVLENLVFAGRGATPPGPEDIGVVAHGKLAAGPLGFTQPPGIEDKARETVHGDHFVWHPGLGVVWRRGPGGQPTGSPVLQGGDWKRSQLRAVGNHYRFGVYTFDPIALRILAPDPGGALRIVPTSPHFLVALFTAIDHAEHALPDPRRVPTMVALRASHVAPSVPATRPRHTPRAARGRSR